MLALHVIASGSRGNACVVEDVETGRGFAIDCGICKRDFLARCAQAGFDVARLDALLITHDHGDHTKGVGSVTRGLAKTRGSAPPLFVLEDVLTASRDLQGVVDSCEVRIMRHGEPLCFGGVQVIPFETSHDSADSCGFRIEGASGDAVGYLTDSGVVTREARKALEDVRILALESNHDPRMLRDGEYPLAIKRRIASDEGHLSNEQAAEELALLLTPRLEHVVAMHLSENNNLPSLARRALGAVLEREGHPATLSIASQRMLVSVR